MKESLVRVRVDSGQILARVSPYLTGACIEDVNHEIYGGIHAQMIFGESFEEEPMELHPEPDPQAAGLEGTISCLAEREHLADASPIRSWQPVRTGTARGRLLATQRVARRGQRSQLIEFLEGEGTVGIENRGLNRWGLHLEAGRSYEGSLVAMAAPAAPAEAGAPELWASLESGDGQTLYDYARLSVPADQAWHTIPFALTPDAGADGARLSLTLRAPGRLWVDYVLLQPGPWGRFKDTVARRDIAEALVRQGLTAMRCGGYMINTDWAHERQCPGSGYRWKKMLGPRPDRPPYRGTFYRFASNGFGIVDFMLLCEAAGFLCVPALNPMEDPRDVGDLLEYANGGPETAWGARRVADGHPAPFGLRYVQIGNEDCGPAFMPTILPILREMAQRDPRVTPVLGAGLWDGGGRIDWRRARYVRAIVEAVRGLRVLWDVHVGGDGLLDAHAAADFMPRLRQLIDQTDPDNRIGLCVLEENGGRHDLQRALGHAHMVMSFERQGLVEIDTPANCLQPWRQNDNGWDQGQLFYTPRQVWGMPPFYAQQMLARHYLPMAVAASPDVDDPLLDVTATRDEDDETRVVKLLNLRDTAVRCCIHFADGRRGVRAEATVLHGDLAAANTPEQPEQVLPHTAAGEWSDAGYLLVVPAHAFMAVRFHP